MKLRLSWITLMEANNTIHSLWRQRLKIFSSRDKPRSKSKTRRVLTVDLLGELLASTINKLRTQTCPSSIVSSSSRSQPQTKLNPPSTSTTLIRVASSLWRPIFSSRCNRPLVGMCLIFSSLNPNPCLVKLKHLLLHLKTNRFSSNRRYLSLDSNSSPSSVLSSKYLTLARQKLPHSKQLCRHFSSLLKFRPSMSSQISVKLHSLVILPQALLLPNLVQLQHLNLLLINNSSQ